MPDDKREYRQLTHTIVKTAKPGRYGDRRGGHGLSLLVKETSTGRNSKTWSQRLRINGKLVSIGLGPFPIISLAEAREKALDNATRVAKGEDILKPPPKAPTVADLFHEIKRNRGKAWTLETTQGWYRSLHYCNTISSKPVSDVTRDDIIHILTDLWHEKPAAGKKVLNHLSTVMKLAINKESRHTNPASTGIARDLGKQRPAQHMKSVDYKILGEALRQVRDSAHWWATRYCFLFLVLTGVRTSEARMATWEEIDLSTSIWTIPAERMKNRIEHKVPLSLQVKEILLHAQDRTERTSGVIFPPQRSAKSIHRSSFSYLLRNLGIQAVPHGSRSSFRNWAGGQSKIAQPAAEMVLVHKQGSEIERTYMTSEFLEHRGPIMQAWADVLSDIMGPVITEEDRANYPPVYHTTR